MQYTFDGELVQPRLGNPGEERCHSCGTNTDSAELLRCGSELEWHCENCGTIACNNCTVESCDTWDMTEINGDMYCDDCRVKLFVQCEDCEEDIRQEDARFTDWGTAAYCEYCFENNFAMCEDCGSVVPQAELNSNYRCGSCVEYDDELGEEGHDYGYKPTPKFNGKGNVFLGVELEVDDGADYVSELVANLSRIDPSEDKFYLKHDGSLANGIEIVTHPATLKAHMRAMHWKEIVDTALESKFKSHNTDTCGLHVHVGRTGLGTDYTAQETTIDKLIAIFWKLEDQLFTFSRRTNSNMNHWSPFNHKSVDNFTPKKAGEAKNRYERYRAINVTNTHTIEFRLFRGTLNMVTLRASIQLVDTLVRIARDYSIAYIINKLTWKDIVNYDANNKELAEYSTTCGL